MDFATRGVNALDLAWHKHQKSIQSTPLPLPWQHGSLLSDVNAVHTEACSTKHHHLWDRSDQSGQYCCKTDRRSWKLSRLCPQIVVQLNGLPNVFNLSMSQVVFSCFSHLTFAPQAQSYHTMHLGPSQRRVFMFIEALFLRPSQVCILSKIILSRFSITSAPYSHTHIQYVKKNNKYVWCFCD